ncbi:helix-turn-helix domain-containing protein, partial [Oligella sp. HMSC09E12]|uniref:helix-turn-helix domain-containing protein n=1 Tax=Oligella sp. HMSC09E12 TaxID=1581147 RepID=UPI00352F2435
MKDLRESLGLSIEWVAEQTGMSANSIKNIESGAKKAPQSIMNFLKQIDDV